MSNHKYGWRDGEVSTRERARRRRRERARRLADRARRRHAR